MMTHHVVHESFKNNISNNTHNIAQRAILFSGGQMPSLAPLKATLTNFGMLALSGTLVHINWVWLLLNNLCSIFMLQLLMLPQ